MEAEWFILHWETVRAGGIGAQQHFTVLASETLSVETLVQSTQSLHSFLALLGNYWLPAGVASGGHPLVVILSAEYFPRHRVQVEAGLQETQLADLTSKTVRVKHQLVRYSQYLPVHNSATLPAGTNIFLVVFFADDFLAVESVVRTLDDLPAVVAVDLCLFVICLTDQLVTV